MKRIISFVLCVSVFVCSLGCVSAFAEDIGECNTINSGNVNDDGAVNILDVVLIMKHIAGWELTNFDVEYADVLNDGNVDISDVTTLLKYIAGWEGIRLGHSDSPYRHEKATCKASGYKEIICTMCGSTFRIELDLLNCDEWCDGTNCTGTRLPLNSNCLNIHKGNYKKVAIISDYTPLAEGLKGIFGEVFDDEIRLDNSSDAEYVIFAGRPYEGDGFDMGKYSIAVRGMYVYVYVPRFESPDPVLDYFREVLVKDSSYIAIPKDRVVSFKGYEWKNGNN